MARARPTFDALVLGAAALCLGAALALGSPMMLVAPLVPLAGVLAARKPEFAVFGVLALLGFEGTLTAHVGLPLNLAVNLLLLGMLVGIVVKILFGNRERRVWLWPGLLLLIAYVGLSGLEVVFADSVGKAFTSFRTSGYFIAIALAIAFAPWSQRTFVSAARAAVLVGIVVSVYGVFRYLVGPSAAESQVALQTWVGLGRPASIEPTFFGSFTHSVTMAVFAATLASVAAALALGERGRWRLLAAVSLAGLLFLVFASESRTALLAAGAGVGITMLLFVLSRPFSSSRRTATAMAATAAVLVVGAVFYSVAITEQESRERYERIITDPAGDPNYFLRLARWEFAIEVASREPFGHGLGTQGTVAYTSPEGPVGPYNLDSSYLKIAVEQGFFVLALYAAGILSLVIGLAAYVRRTLDRQGALLAAASAGVAASAAVLFYALSVEGIQLVPIWLLIGLGAAMPVTRALSAGRPRAERAPDRPRDRAGAPGSVGGADG